MMELRGRRVAGQTCTISGGRPIVLVFSLRNATRGESGVARAEASACPCISPQQKKNSECRIAAVLTDLKLMDQIGGHLKTIP